MPYVWLWLLIAKLDLLLPNRWKVSLHCQEGSTPSSHANACLICIFRFSGVFFCPFKFYTIFTEDFYSCYYKNYCNTVLNHGMAATLFYANRGLTYTPSIAYFAARTLRAEGETRNASLQRWV